MSQDMFADEEMADDPEEMVEFSGVSCSGTGTSSSPGSQSQPPPPPPPPPPSPAAPKVVVELPEKTAEGYICPVCGKGLATPRGYKGHVARHSTTESSQPSVSQGEACPVCKKILKTTTGFLKHMAAHKFKDAVKRRPDTSQFIENYLEPLMCEIVQEVLEEPSFGDVSKSAFLIDCEKSENWPNFVNALGAAIASFVFGKQTKVLPLNQYEDMQRKINSYLNLNIDSLKSALICCSSIEISDALAGQLVFRIAMKLCQGAQKWLMKIMHDEVTESPSNHQDMTEAEEKLFLRDVGGFVRDLFEKGLKTHSEQRRSDCIKSVFVDGQHPISKSQFLKKKNWYSGEENCIVLSSHASSFFKIIELEIMPPTIDTSNSQEVLENSLLHRGLLDHWYYLSSQHFSEDLSLLFLRDLITSYVKFSLQFEEKRLNRLHEKSVRASTVALRTHLQRNFEEKSN